MPELPPLSETCAGNCNGQSVESTGINVVKVMTWAIGAASVLFIILGAISLITSNGNPDKVKKGKQTILGAIIGLVVAILTAVILGQVARTATTGQGPIP